MTELKIVHVIEKFSLGGAERGLFNLIANSTNINFNHTICAFIDGPMHNDFKKLGVDTRVIVRRHTFDYGCFKTLVNNFRNCSLVHCRNSTSAVTLGGLAARLAGIPFVTSVHGHGMFEKSGLKIQLWYAMHRSAQATIAVSRSIAREMEMHGHPKKKLQVIHNGLDLDAYSRFILSAEERRRLRTELSEGKEGPLIGCIGSLRGVKGQKFLIMAFKQVIGAIPSARLLLAGDGPDRTMLEELARESGVAEAVIFLGFRTDAFAVMQCLDALVVPSVSEGISNVILEAMAFKTPVVATAVGGTPEIVADGIDGYLTGYGNEERLAAALVTLLNDSETRETFVANGHAKIVKDFSLARMVSEYEDVYRRACV